MRIFALVLCLAAFGLPGAAGVIYSGTQNITTVGGTLNIHLTGSSSSWDLLSLSAFPVSGQPTSIGTTLIHPTFGGVGLSYGSGIPYIASLPYGSPSPTSLAIGSGQFFLWNRTLGNFTSGTNYAVFMMGVYGGGPQYMGWVEILTENTNTASPRLTVVQWAYSDVPGTPPPFVGTVPEPAAYYTTGAGILLFWGLKKRRR